MKLALRLPGAQPLLRSFVVSAVSLLVCFGSPPGQQAAGQESAASARYTMQNVPLRDAIDKMAEIVHLNVVYHVSSLWLVDKTNASINDLTAPDALSVLLTGYLVGYTQIDRRTIMVLSMPLAAAGAPSIADVIAIADREDAAEKRNPSAGAEQSKKTDVEFHSVPLRSAIELITTRFLRRQLIVDPLAIDSLSRFTCTVKLKDVTALRALQFILDANDLTYEPAGDRELRILVKNSGSNPPPRSLEQLIKKSK